jgi:hypothetical protein
MTNALEHRYSLEEYTNVITCFIDAVSAVNQQYYKLLVDELHVKFSMVGYNARSTILCIVFADDRSLVNVLALNYTCVNGFRGRIAKAMASR